MTANRKRVRPTPTEQTRNERRRPCRVSTKASSSSPGKRASMAAAQPDKPARKWKMTGITHIRRRRQREKLMEQYTSHFHTSIGHISISIQLSLSASFRLGMHMYEKWRAEKGLSVERSTFRCTNIDAITLYTGRLLQLTLL